MSEQEDRLNEALSRFLEDRETIEPDLQSYSPVLRELDALRVTPERDEAASSSSRKAFIDYAKSMPSPVSEDQKPRLNLWKSIFGRERKPMSAVLSIALALIFAFGGVGITAYAAQDSLPTEPLYPVKEITEQFRLALTTDDEVEVQLLLDFVEERIGEMVSLANSGESVPEKTQVKLQEQLNLALMQATQLGDPALAGVLQRVQAMAQNQIQTMTQAQINQSGDSPCEALQLAIKAMNRVRNEAEDGLEDPVTFRQRQGINRPENAPQQPNNEPAGKHDPESNSGNEDTGEGNGNGPGEGSGGNRDDSGNGSGNQGSGNENGSKGTNGGGN